MAEGTRYQTAASLPGPADKDEANRRLQSALFLVVPAEQESSIQAPVINLQGESANVYPLVEKHLRPEYVLGFERFWRLVKSAYDPEIAIWRPRVQGIQLKALKCMRLPESDEEWGQVREAAHGIGGALKDGANTAAALVADLMQHAVWVRSWWSGRNSKNGAAAAGTKRGQTRSNSLQSSVKRQAVSYPTFTTALSAPAEAAAMMNGNGNGAAIAMGGIPGVPNSSYRQLRREDSGSGQLPASFMSGGLPPTGCGGSSQPSSGDPLVPLGLVNGHGGSGNLGQHNTGSGAANGHAGMHNVLSTSDVQSLMASMVPQGRHRSEPALRSLLAQQQAAVAPAAVLTPHTAAPQPATGSVSPSPSPGAQGRAPNHAQQAALQQQQAAAVAAAQRQNLLALLSDLEQRIMTLNVGGQRFVTTAATLAAVEHSFLWKLVFLNPNNSSPRSGQTGEFFIDRTNRVFDHVIEYLRTLRYSDAELPLPKGRGDLALLVREADFYGLPELSERAQVALAACSDREDSSMIQLEIRIDNQGVVSVQRC